MENYVRRDDVAKHTVEELCSFLARTPHANVLDSFLYFATSELYGENLRKVRETLLALLKDDRVSIGQKKRIDDALLRIDHRASWKPVEVPPQVIEIAARAAHEANRAYCLSMDDRSQSPWNLVGEEKRESCRKGVLGLIAGNGPRQSHEGWMVERTEAGWVHGEIKDEHAKTHPCLVPYDRLPEPQRRKNDLFVGVACAVLDALAPGWRSR